MSEVYCDLCEEMVEVVDQDAHVVDCVYPSCPLRADPYSLSSNKELDFEEDDEGGIYPSYKHILLEEWENKYE